jgi:hypothetical protein
MLDLNNTFSIFFHFQAALQQVIGQQAKGSQIKFALFLHSSRNFPSFLLAKIVKQVEIAMPILTAFPDILSANIVQHPQRIFINEKYLISYLQPAISHPISEVTLLEFGSCGSRRHAKLHIVEDEIEDKDCGLVVDVAFVVFAQNVGDVAAAQKGVVVGGVVLDLLAELGEEVRKSGGLGGLCVWREIREEGALGLTCS